MPNLHQLKEEICDIGRRIYAKGFAAGNDGNISYRLGENQVLCTPTMICKGFIKPDDLCIVDMEGKQLRASKRTSEVMLHLAIMKARPEVKSVVHCHPPHATAFAVAREPIPQCVLPEVEVFLGDVPITKYETPGGQPFADTVLPFVHKANVIILANHGTVSYGETVEKAYWWTEILDAYCRILMLAKDLGGVTYFSEQKTRELLRISRTSGATPIRVSPRKWPTATSAPTTCSAIVGKPPASNARRSPLRPRWDRAPRTARRLAGRGQQPRRVRSGGTDPRHYRAGDGGTWRQVSSVRSPAAWPRPTLEPPNQSKTTSSASYPLMKVSIIGGGGLVGSCTGFALQAGKIVREIALLDVNATWWPAKRSTCCTGPASWPTRRLFPEATSTSRRAT